MSLGVEGECGKILLPYSPYALKYFPRILRICIEILSSHSEMIFYIVSNPTFVAFFHIQRVSQTKLGDTRCSAIRRLGYT
jgi:hypothetical protein